MAKNSQLLIVFDDLQSQLQPFFINQLVTVYSHNLGISIILTQQQLFTKETKTVRNNMLYYCLLKSPSQELAIKTLGSQLFPKSKFFMEAFRDAVREPYGYLIIDLRGDTPENERLKTHIWPSEFMVTYSSRY